MSRFPAWAKVTLTVVTVVVLVISTFVVFVVGQLSGGFGHVFHRQPDPSAIDVEAARATATTSTRAEIDRVTGSVVSPALVRPALVASGNKDLCDFGRHNWKVNDSYDLACSQDRDTVVGFDVETFRAQAVALHAALVADGWVESEMHLDRVVSEYWDARASFGNPLYGVSDLPAASYTRADRR